jgi:hypothetical protein
MWVGADRSEAQHDWRVLGFAALSANLRIVLNLKDAPFFYEHFELKKPSYF